jgi:hypothetical protein
MDLKGNSLKKTKLGSIIKRVAEKIYRLDKVQIYPDIYPQVY